MTQLFTAIGLMSGTSMDGVDIALLRTDGKGVAEPLGSSFTPYPDDVRSALRACLGLASDPDGRIAKAAELVTDWHIKAVKDFGKQADLIGFHGQTIFHDPANARTWQIGNGERLAKETGIDVVYDFRTNDMKHGGQGAPLMPIYHRVLVEQSKAPQPACFLNLGGVANITWIDGDEIFACDTGPANALLDDWMLKQTGQAMDKDGATALKGKIDQARIDKWLSESFFQKPAPKSLDRDAFKHCTVDDLSLEDGAATLAAFTAQAVLKALPERPKSLIVAGGGRRNPAIMQHLKPVIDADSLGWSGDALEAEGFAYLAVRSLKGLALSLPTTTGCTTPVTGGRLAKAK